MGLLLYLASCLLGIILIPVGIIFGFFKTFYHEHVGNAFTKANAKFLKMAIGTDIFGNVYGEELLNATLITKDSEHLFGEFGITISEVLGWNQINGTLSRTGKCVAGILNFIQKDHCIKATQDSSLH